MRFGIRSTSVANVNDVATDLITSRRVIFTPNLDIMDELKRTAINITCYDRNGDLVKRVTSADDGDVEDNENDPSAGSGTGENQGEEQGNAPAPKKTVALSASPAGSGTVNGAGQYDAGASATISAVAASGYHFVKWSDNNTSATRTVTVNSDLTLQAIFAADAPQGGGDEGGGSGSGGGSEEEAPYNYGD